MNIGYFTQPFHPIGRKIHETLEEDYESAIIADRNGYKEAFFGEHVTDKYETITSSLSFISSLAYSTKNIFLGTGTINVPNHHPVQVASTISMIDNMLKGRFIMGISMGALPTDSEIFGNLKHNKESMFEEGMKIILNLWKQKPPFNFKGNFWNISTEETMNNDLGLGDIIKPYQKPHPEIVCTALSPNSIGLFKAAQKGWSPISSNFLHVNSIKSHWESYSKGIGCKNPEKLRKIWRIARMIFINEDHKKAINYAKSKNGPYGQCINQILKKLRAANRLFILKEHPDQDDNQITLDYCLDNLVIAGDPKSVSDQIAKFNSEVGKYGTLLYVGVDWLDKELAKKSMELMSNKVIVKN